jgi:aspartyl-tRNA(Asn)/glutamyl-tRNA(Gln) amidotransferase subunit A
VEVVTRSLERIRDLQPVLNAFTVVLDESALVAARDADEAVRRGGQLPALHGVPVSVKDHIWMADSPATNGSLILRDFVPPQDAVPPTTCSSASPGTPGTCSAHLGARAGARARRSRLG